MVKVKGYWKYIVGLLLALVLGLVCGAIFWLLSTTDGARWLIREATRRADLPITVERVAGRLSRTLTLEGIEVRYPKVQVELDRLQVSWRPGALLRAKLLVTGLEAEGLRVTDNRPPDEKEEEPFALQWPELPDWAGRVRAELRRIELQRLIWQRPGQPPQVLDRIAGRIIWTGKELEIPSLTATGPPGTLTASLRARWPQSRIRLEATARLRELAGGEAGFDLTLDLRPVKDGAEIAGDLRLAATTLPTGKLDLTGHLALDRQAVSLRDFALRQVDNGGRISGDLRVDLSAESPQVAADLALDSVDLARLAGRPTDLNGSLQLSGRIEDYQGRFDLANRAQDWQAVRLAGPFSGNSRQVVLPELTGRLLQGRVDGELTVAWQPELLVQGKLTGKALNPSVFHPDWQGNINFEAESRWRQPAEGPMDLAVRGRLLESSLRGYELRGRVDGRLRGAELDLAALELQGEGVSLSASGALHRRIDFKVRARDLATLLPDVSGALQSSGWLRRRDGQLVGEAEGTGRRLRYKDILLEEAGFSARARSLPEGAEGEVNLRLRQLQLPNLAAIDADLRASGTPAEHRASGTIRLPRDTSLELALAGGYREQLWQGTLQRLVLRDPVGPWRLRQPVPLVLSPETLEVRGLRLAGAGQEELSADAALQLKARTGRVHLQWRSIRLARINPWLETGRLSGSTSGRAVLDRPSEAEQELSLAFDLAGRFEQDNLALGLRTAKGDLNWNRQGLRGTLAAELTGGGRLEGRVRSEEPAGTAPPARGEWELTWEGLELQHLRPWLPEGMVAQGTISGRSGGTWAPDGVLTAQGGASLGGGLLEAPAGDTLVSMPLEEAEISWDWRDDRLEGQTSLILKDRGRLAGHFRLPVAARLPVAIEPEGRLDSRLEGNVREEGLVATLLPGIVQETRGLLRVNLVVSGVWRQPEFSGVLRLSEAGAYVPAAGIELKEISLEAELQKDRVELTALSVKSGPGEIHGTGTLFLQQWRLADYRMNLEGQRFELIRLPELQAQVNPRLEVEGTPERIAIQGTVVVPEFLLRESERETVLTPSEDVVIVGAEAPPAKEAPMVVMADIELVLGDHVLVKMAGLDARLSGRLDLKANGVENITAHGRISVAEGDYRAYGAKLKIERGNLLFSGPPEQPTLDILALRTAGEVKAGVRVTGTPRAPVVELYSDPAMSDSDRLAYIVLGHPFARDGGEASLLMSAAGALLSRGESASLQDRLKRQLGLDVLGFETGEGDIGESVLTVGKYLHPDLYVSIGQSLFSETTEFRVRYKLGERWEVESKTGTESGVDLYYKIEFR
jgi:translocation and assembly module TamB